MTCQELLVLWLNNAYSMEMGMIQTLEEHAEDASEIFELRKSIDDRIELLEHHADLVRAEIERLGGEISEVKSFFSQVFGTVEGLQASLSQEKMVKNVIAEHATEHFEVATYLAIAKAADYCGEGQTAELVRKIMKEERTSEIEMEERLGMVVRYYMDQNIEE